MRRKPDISYCTAIFHLTTDSFALNILIDILDYLTNMLSNFVPEILNITSEYAYFYISLLITYYLYNKGVKKIIVLPISYIVFIAISLYSFNPKITYIKNEGLLISYKGDRIVVSNEGVDTNKLKDKTSAFRGYGDFNKINISNENSLKKQGKDYILNASGNNYYLNMSNKNKKDLKYDIINFKDNEASEIIILGKYLLIK